MKRMKRLITAILLASLFLVGCAGSAEPPLQSAGAEPVSPLPGDRAVNLIFAADIHYLTPRLHEEGSPLDATLACGDGKLVQYSLDIFEAFLEDVKRKAPDALILGGDLTFNGALQSHQGLERLLGPISEAGIPVLVIPGNHDINSPKAYRFTKQGPEPVESTTEKTFWEIYAPLGSLGAKSVDPYSKSYLYPLSENLQLLMIDASIHNPGEVSDGGKIKEETFPWIEDRLQEAQQAGAKVIAVTHHSLLTHNPNFEQDVTLENGTRLAGLLNEYQVPLNLSGHMHVQHIKRSGDKSGIYDAATGALSVYPHYYAEITIEKDKSIQYKTQTVDVTTWAIDKWIADENLLSFEEYSLNFFKGCTASKLESLLSAYDLPTETKREMIAFAQDLNAEYYAGMPPESGLDDPLFALWQRHCPETFYTQYLKSILADQTESRFLEIP